LGGGREGTAHFRRLTPPSFAAQNPLQGAAIFIRADVPEGDGARSKIACATRAVRVTDPSTIIVRLWAARGPLTFGG
jgi:hypothetical protein